jgi:uncharacterized RDD family membrane protein YckC
LKQIAAQTQQMNTIDRPIGTGTRIATMLMDHFIMAGIATIFCLPAMVQSFAGLFTVSHEAAEISLFTGPARYIALLGFALYFCKDSFNGRSLAKRILGLQVVDNKTGQPATALQCLLRNLFCILWIVEFFVAVSDTASRIGDRVAGTRLVRYAPWEAQPGTNPGSLLTPLAISYLVMLSVTQLLPSFPSFAGAAYVKTSYNKAESVALQSAITKGMGQDATPDVRVYDSVKNEKLKYVSVIVTLHKNYLQDDDSYDWLHARLCKLAYAYMPKEQFTGVVKYSYSAMGKFISRQQGIGADVMRKKHE